MSCILLKDTEAINLEVTGNSHNASNAGNQVGNKVMEEGNDDPDSPVKDKVSSGGSRKEKSVLQAKLTKLAIQIGYGGELLYFCNTNR